MHKGKKWKRTIGETFMETIHSINHVFRVIFYFIILCGLLFGIGYIKALQPFNEQPDGYMKGKKQWIL